MFRFVSLYQFQAVCLLYFARRAAINFDPLFIFILMLLFNHIFFNHFVILFYFLILYSPFFPCFLASLLPCFLASLLPFLSFFVSLFVSFYFFTFNAFSLFMFIYTSVSFGVQLIYREDTDPKGRSYDALDSNG